MHNDGPRNDLRSGFAPARGRSCRDRSARAFPASHRREPKRPGGTDRRLQRLFHAAAWDARGYGDSDDYPLDFGDFADNVLRFWIISEQGKRNLQDCRWAVQDFYDRFPDQVSDPRALRREAGFYSHAYAGKTRELHAVAAGTAAGGQLVGGVSV